MGMQINAKQAIFGEWREAAAYGAILLVTTACLWQAPFGVDFTDEPYAVALADWIIKGSVPFKDIWAMHVTSSIYMLPLLLFRRVLGLDNNGLILCCRIMYAIVQCLVSVYCYRTLRRKFARINSLAVAILFQVACPLCIKVFNYNNVMLLLLELIIVTYIARDRLINRIVLGAATAFLVITYPTMILLAPLVAALFIFDERSRGGKQLWVPFISATVVAALFCVFMGMLGATPDVILSNISNVIDVNRFDGTSSPQGLAKLFETIYTYAGKSGSVALIAFLLLCLLVRSNVISGKGRRIVHTCTVLLGCVNGVYWTISCAANLASRPRSVYLAGYIVFYAALVAGALYLSLTGDESKPTRSCFLIGVVAFLIVNATTDQGLQISGFASLPLLAIPLLSADVRILSLGEGNDPQMMSKRLHAVCIFGISLACLATLCGTRLIGIYRDEHIDELDTVITEGPAAGLVTTETRANKYTEMLDMAIDGCNEAETIAVEIYYPMAYLAVDARPLGFSPGRVQISSAKLGRWYLGHNVRPDVILIYNNEYAAYQWGDEDDRKGVFGRLLESGDYQVTEYSCGKVYSIIGD